MTTLRFLFVCGLVAAPLAAQHPVKPDSVRPGMMGPRMMQSSIMQDVMAPMMQAMAYTPDHLVMHKDKLALSAAQVTRLTALRDAAKATHDDAAADAKTHLEAMRQTMNAASPDTGALKLHFLEAHKAMGIAHWAMLSAAAQAKAVLTDAQRAKVQAWADSMQSVQQQHREMPGSGRTH